MGTQGKGAGRPDQPLLAVDPASGESAMPRMRHLTCPHCGLRLNVRQSSVGSLIRCKGCGGKIEVTAPSCLPAVWLGCGGLCLLAVSCLVCIGLGGRPPRTDRPEAGTGPEVAAKGGAPAPSDTGREAGSGARAEPLLTLSGHREGVKALAFSPDGRRVVALGNSPEGGEARVWDSATGQQLLTITGSRDEFLDGLAFSPDGKTLALGWSVSAGTEWQYVLKLHDAGTGRAGRSIPLDAPAHGVAFSPSGKRVAAAGGVQAGVTAAWVVASGRRLWSHPADAGLASLAYAPDGKRIAVASRGPGGPVELLDGADGLVLLTIKDHPDSPRGLAFSPDGTRIALAEFGATFRNQRVERNWGAARLWDAATGQTLLTLASYPEQEVTSLAFSPGGRWLAVGAGRDHFDARSQASGGSGEAAVWDAATGGRVLTVGGHARPVTCVAFSPDGRRLATGSEDGTVRVWDVSDLATAERQTGRRPITPPGDPDPPGQGRDSLLASARADVAKGKQEAAKGRHHMAHDLFRRAAEQCRELLGDDPDAPDASTVKAVLAEAEALRGKEQRLSEEAAAAEKAEEKRLEREAEATRALKRAQEIVDEVRRRGLVNVDAETERLKGRAQLRLRELIKKYRGTAAAKEAQKLLDDL